VAAAAWHGQGKSPSTAGALVSRGPIVEGPSQDFSDSVLPLSNDAYTAS
jgi:hypothetical protein